MCVCVYASLYTFHYPCTRWFSKHIIKSLTSAWATRMNVRHLSCREWVLIIFHINECKRFSSNDLKNSHIPTEITANVYTFVAFCVLFQRKISANEVLHQIKYSKFPFLFIQVEFWCNLKKELLFSICFVIRSKLSTDKLIQ